MLPLIGLGIGVAGAIGKMIGRGKANRQMNKLLQQDPTYTENPLAKQRLGLAQMLLNSRMPGAAAAERNIYGNQANYLGNVQKNATDSSQALALGSAAIGQTNQSFQDLAQQEAQNYQQNYQNLVGAQEGVINEGDKVFNDQIRRFQDKVQFKGAQNENRQNNWGDLSNMGFALGNFGIQGGFDNIFKKKQSPTNGGGMMGNFGGSGW